MLTLKKYPCRYVIHILQLQIRYVKLPNIYYILDLMTLSK